MSNRTPQSPGLRSLLYSRIPTTGTALILLAGDLLALFGFVAVGQYRHGYVFWENPARTVVVLSPIVGSWLVLAPLSGLVTESSLTGYRDSVLRVVPAWILVAIVSSLVRRTDLVPGYAPPSFFLVSIVFGLLFLGGWRLLATSVIR